MKKGCPPDPPDSRAWARAALLRLAGPERVRDVNWDSITFLVHTRAGAATRTVELPDPHLSRTCYELLTRDCTTLDETLDALGATQPVLLHRPAGSGAKGYYSRRY